MAASITFQSILSLVLTNLITTYQQMDYCWQSRTIFLFLLGNCSQSSPYEWFSCCLWCSRCWANQSRPHWTFPYGFPNLCDWLVRPKQRPEYYQCLGKTNWQNYFGIIIAFVSFFATSTKGFCVLAFFTKYLRHYKMFPTIWLLSELFFPGLLNFS